MSSPDMRSLAPETRAVIDAVLEAIDIPHAATVAHDETRSKLLEERLLHLKVAFSGIVSYADAEVAHLDVRFTSALENLREKLAEHPATGYVTYEQAQERLAAGATWSESVRLDDCGQTVKGAA